LYKLFEVMLKPTFNPPLHPASFTKSHLYHKVSSCSSVGGTWILSLIMAHERLVLFLFLHITTVTQPSSPSSVEPGQLAHPPCSPVARMQTEDSDTGFEVHTVVVSVTVSPDPSY